MANDPARPARVRSIFDAYSVEIDALKQQHGAGRLNFARVDAAHANLHVHLTRVATAPPIVRRG